MTTITKQCEADGCTETFTYGIESINVPKYCSFDCRDRAENMGVHAPPREREF